MEKTYEVVVAHESLRAGQRFSSEETIRLKMLVAGGYFRVVEESHAAAATDEGAAPKGRGRKVRTEE